MSFETVIHILTNEVDLEWTYVYPRKLLFVWISNAENTEYLIPVCLSL